jgi:DNA (cytosine-5)-methyltransferase 1
MEKFTAVDLFAGAGGLGEGFRQAGFQIVGAVEQHPYAAATYSCNHPSTAVVCLPIQEVEPVEFRRSIGMSNGELDALIGGPPCQGFSESNRRTRCMGNPRNHLYLEFVRFVEAFRPRWVVIENVAGLLTLSRGAILTAICSALGSAGYRTGWVLVDAAEHGVPQHRRRLFIVGRREDASAFDLTLTPESGPPVRVIDAISDLPELENGSSVDLLPYRLLENCQLTPFQQAMRAPNPLRCRVSGNLVTKNAPHVIERYGYIPQGGNWAFIPQELMTNYSDSSRCHTGIYHRLEWMKPSKVIGNFRKNMLIHPDQQRGLSVREAARLQTFPDAYVFRGSIGHQQQQVADAVPPLLARAVATRVSSQLVGRNAGSL